MRWRGARTGRARVRVHSAFAYEQGQHSEAKLLSQLHSCLLCSSMACTRERGGTSGLIPDPLRLFKRARLLGPDARTPCDAEHPPSWGRGPTPSPLCPLHQSSRIHGAGDPPSPLLMGQGIHPLPSSWGRGSTPSPLCTNHQEYVHIAKRQQSSTHPKSQSQGP